MASRLPAGPARSFTGCGLLICSDGFALRALWSAHICTGTGLAPLLFGDGIVSTGARRPVQAHAAPIQAHVAPMQATVGVPTVQATVQTQMQGGVPIQATGMPEMYHPSQHTLG